MPATPRVLTERELNRALLARQLLLERARLPLPRALERVGGIQAQYAPSMYIGLWSRLDGFERDALTRALHRRAVVQATLMRSTIHLVSRRDYWPLAVAIRARLPTRARVYKKSESEFERAAARVRAFLADGPKRDREIADALGPETWRPASASGRSSCASRRRVPGSGAAPSSRRTPRTGSGPRTSRPTTRSTCSSAATSAGSGPPRPRRSPTGQA